MRSKAPADGDAIERRMAREMESLRAISQVRALGIAEGIDLSSNDYLGLAYNQRLKQALIDSIGAARRVGGTGARLLSGNAPEWEELEAEFAAFAGTEAALYFGSGYAANLGLLTSLLRPGDVVFSDALNHASLIDGMRLSGAQKIIFPHHDLRFLENALREHTECTGAKLIVTESVFSMEGDVAPLEQMLRLAKRYGAGLIIDEAHATGVHVREGAGKRRGVRLRQRRPERLSGQSRADVCFQHGNAAVLLRANSGGDGTSARGGT